MSAPDTNIEVQKRKHRFVLLGLAAVVIAAGVVFIANVYAGLDSDAAWTDDDAQMIEPQG